ncbi:unnamed protein product [Chrysoparadoxa australica]
MWVLHVIEQGAEIKKKLHLNSDHVVIAGRGESSPHTKFADSSVSRKHAKIKASTSANGKCALGVTDLGSKYGTKLNSTRLRVKEEVQANDGDKIQLGVAGCFLEVHWVPIQLASSSLGNDGRGGTQASQVPTGVEQPNKKARIRKLAAAVGAEVVNEVAGCTHLLTADSAVLTTKVMLALTAGKPVVKLSWLEEVAARKSPADEMPDPAAFVPGSIPSAPHSTSRGTHLAGCTLLMLAKDQDLEAVAAAASAKLLRLYDMDTAAFEALLQSLGDANGEERKGTKHMLVLPEGNCSGEMSKA